MLWEFGTRQKLAQRNFKVWELGSCSMPLQASLANEYSASVNRVIWSPDGTLCGVAYSKHTIHLYAYHGGDNLQDKLEIEAHVGSVNDLAFCFPNKQLCIVTCGEDRLIKVQLQFLMQAGTSSAVGAPSGSVSTFSRWLGVKNARGQIKDFSDDLYSLSQGSLEPYNSYQSCIVNGVRFRCKEYDDTLRMQCSGVCTNLIEKFFLFRCKWCNTNPKGRSIYMDNILTSMNTSTNWYPTEPFILATQAQQVFYFLDMKRGSYWRVVQKVNHRNVYDIPELSEVSNDQPNNDVFQEEESFQLPPFKPIEDLIESSLLVRRDVASVSVSSELVVDLFSNNEKL